MATAVMPTAPPTAPPGAPPASPGPVSFLRGRSTPARYRLGSVVAAVTLVALAVAASTTAAALGARADRVRDRTGPVLVATQQLYSSLAEADAAAAAVQLSGRQEDREQRRFYEQALERSTQQLERVASLIGDDPAAHRSLADIAARLTRYSGLVEQARAENRLGAPTSGATLATALDLMRSGIGADVAELTARTEDRFGTDAERSTARLAVTVLMLLAALVVLGALQRSMTRRSRRLLNPPTLLGTVLVLTLGVWLVLAETRQHADVRDARATGYEAIARSSQIQATAYRAKAEESLTLLGAAGASFAVFDTNAAALASGPVTPAVVDAVRRGTTPALDGLLVDAARAADSARERAAAAEMLTRWQRYRDANASIRQAAARGDAAGAALLATTEGNRTFNGFNLSVESLLQDNTEQFGRGLAAAHDRLRLLDLASVVLPLLALLLMLWGVQLRIREYR